MDLKHNQVTLHFQIEKKNNLQIHVFPYFSIFLKNWLILLIPGIRNLVGEPDYRQVRLHWEVEDDPHETQYQIRYCELQTWGTQRCRTLTAPQPEENEVEDNAKMYSAEVKGLRMATTYSFEVKKVKEQGERENRADGDDKNQNIIVIPTKGCKWSGPFTFCFIIIIISALLFIRYGAFCFCYWS